MRLYKTILLIIGLIVMMKNRAIGNSVPGFVDCGKDPVVKIYKDDGYSRMLIVNPDGHRSGDNRPAIVWIHGGGWMAGCPEQYIAHCRWTAWRGAVGIAISYTLLQNPNCHTSFIKGPSISDCLDDCRAAIKYIRKNAVQLGIDPIKSSLLEIRPADIWRCVLVLMMVRKIQNLML